MAPLPLPLFGRDEAGDDPSELDGVPEAEADAADRELTGQKLAPIHGQLEIDAAVRPRQSDARPCWRRSWVRHRWPPLRTVGLAGEA
jgi:hypothetical protein